MRIYIALLVVCLTMTTQIWGQSTSAYNDDGSIIDILVVYNTEIFKPVQVSKVIENGTEKCKILYPPEVNVSQWIDEAIRSANQSLRNSGVNFRLDCVHKELIPYQPKRITPDPSVDCYSMRVANKDTRDFDKDYDLDNLINGKNGLEGVESLRERYHADVVLLITNCSYGGQNNQLNNLGDKDRWGVCGAGATSVFIHELGHSMGGLHETWSGNQPNKAIFPYAHGKRGSSYSEANTIILDSGRPISGPTFGYIPIYSNPELIFRGQKLGNIDNADNRRTFNETSPAIAKFQNSEVSWTGCTDTEWNNGNNWSTGRVPRSIDDVMIPSGLSKYPTISGGNAVSRNLIVEKGAKLDMTNGQLDVRGHLVSEGTFLASGGTIIMKSHLNKALQLQLSNSSYLNNLVIGTDESNTWVKLNNDTKIKGNIIIEKGSLLDHNNKKIVVEGNWTDNWGGAFDYSYSQIRIVGNHTILKTPYAFPIASANTYSSGQTGWFSISEFGNRGVNWMFGGGKQCWLNASSVDKDEPAYSCLKNKPCAIDAWLFLPFVPLSGNSEYTLKFAYDTDNDPRTVSVHYGNIQLPSRMSKNPSFSTQVPVNTVGKQINGIVKVPKSGAYSIGIRSYHNGPNNAAYSYIQNISVTPTPNVPTDFGKNSAISITTVKEDKTTTPPAQIGGKFQSGDKVCIDEKDEGIVKSYDVCQKNYVVEVNGADASYPEFKLKAGACQDDPLAPPPGVELFHCGSEFYSYNKKLYIKKDGKWELFCDNDPKVIYCIQSPGILNGKEVFSSALELEINGKRYSYYVGNGIMKTKPGYQEVDISAVCTSDKNDPTVDTPDGGLIECMKKMFILDENQDKLYEKINGSWQLLRTNVDYVLCESLPGTSRDNYWQAILVVFNGGNRERPYKHILLDQ